MAAAMAMRGIGKSFAGIPVLKGVDFTVRRGEIHALVFTSSPQVDRLYEVAAERGLGAVLTAGLGRTRVAAVGPVVAENLRRRGARVDVCPEQGFVMKNLVQQLKRALA